ncbi:MAG: hypothetical protein ACKOYM_03140, partial [Actinomycetes bacterium]
MLTADGPGATLDDARGGGHHLSVPRVRPPTVDVLIVAASCDQRRSTAELWYLAESLADLPQVHVATWFLRRAADAPTESARAWRNERVVDDLRTWFPVRAARAARLERVAGWIAGARLRRWFAQVHPQLVVLDDALGGRILPKGFDGAVV